MPQTEYEILMQIADLFEHPREQIDTSTPLQDIEAWDSLGLLMLIAWLDKGFEVIATEDEVQVLTSVDDIIRLLRTRGKIQ